MKFSGTIWVNQFLALLPDGAIILEIGSATGRDAHYIESKGPFKVIRTDASDGFINFMRSQGQKAQLYDPIKAPFEKPYDAIFAAAVLLHFDGAQLKKALSNLLKNLPRGGLFLFWTKQGEGEEFSNAKMDSPRYFKYWHPESLRHILMSSGFTIVREGETEAGKWLNYILRKD